MKNYFVGILSIVLIASCTDPKMQKVETLKTECIAIHDEVMPRMSEIVEISSGIKEMRAELDTDTTDSAALIRKNLVLQVELLDSAHESMMVWMNEYVPDYDLDHDADQSIKFYEEQKVRIAEVKELMLKSIEDGKNTLEKME
jgi:hypothetical protein